MQAALYLVPMPLGEGAWATLPPQVLVVLPHITYWVVEEPRTARRHLSGLLRHLGWTSEAVAQYLQTASMQTLNEHTPTGEVQALLQPALAGHPLGLMSEAGLPAVADPGQLLVRAAHAAGVGVQPLVGPSALLLALMASGLNGQHFSFVGYLPRKADERKRALQELDKTIQRTGATQLFIEAPYRNQQLLQDVLAVCQPQTMLCVATDLTLPTQSIHTHSIGQWRKIAPPDIDKRPTVFVLGQ